MAAFNYRRGWRKAEMLGRHGWTKRVVIKSAVPRFNDKEMTFDAYRPLHRDKAWLVRVYTSDGLELTLRGSSRAATVTWMQLTVERLYVGDLMEVK